MKRYALLLLCISLFLAAVFGAPVFADDSITVRVGLYENNPKIFTDENGDAAGFWPDIIEYIAAEEGWEIEYVPGTWAQCLSRLENNEIDIMPDVAYTEERAALYDFSNETVYVSWSRVYTRGGVDIESVLDLEGKNIAVLRGSVNVEGPDGIKVLVSEFDINCTFIEVDSYTRVFELVESEEADAGVTSKDFGYKHEAEFNVVETAIIFQPSSLYFAFPQDSSLTPYLIERIDSCVEELKADQDSIYYQALATWFGIEPTEKPVIPAWLKWILIGVGGLAVLLGGGYLILCSQVRSRTKELREEISQRKKAEEALQQSSQRFNDIAENALEWIWEVDAEGKYTYASPVVEQILGYKPEEVIGKYFYDLFHPDDREELKKAAFAVFAEKQSFRQFVNRNIRKDGEIVWLVTSGVPILDGEGNFLGYRGADIDITESKQAEEALRESEAFQSELLSNSPIPISVINADSSIRYVNPALEKLTGFAAEELLWRKPPYPYWPEERQKEIMKAFKKAMRKGDTRAVELFRKKSGEGFWVEITVTPVKKDGKFQYLLANWVDVTERKRAGETLRQSEARLAEAQRVAHIGSWELDLTSNDLIWSDEVYRIFGLEPQQFGATYEAFLENIHPDDREMVNKAYTDSLKTKTPYDIIHRLLLKDGTVKYVNEKCETFYGNEGKPVRSIGTVQDVTERKKAEETLKKWSEELEERVRRRTMELEQRSRELAEANVRLEEMSRHKSQFLANMSHELRTPLNSIIGYTKLMLDGLEGEISEEQRKDLQTVYNNSQSLLALINDLLDLSKIEAGKVTVTNEAFAIAELLDEVVPSIRRLAEGKGLALEYSVSPGIDHLYADRAKTKQTLVNLLGNAVKFTEKGSIKLDVAEGDGEFVFSVSDTGMGIKKENLKVIFESFKQVGPAQIAGFEGTGLGLAISKQFVEMQGGRIWAESELGKGSIFTFTLPKKKSPRS